MFNGLGSDSMALRHVWLGLREGRFQCDGGLRIAAATARCDFAEVECLHFPTETVQRQFTVARIRRKPVAENLSVRSKTSLA